MPKFELLLTQMVERTAVHEIEADDADAALDIAREIEGQLRIGIFRAPLTWEAGDDASDPNVYAILDAEGDQIWSR